MTTNNEDLVAKLHNAANACHDEPGWMWACELFSLAADRLAALTTGQEIDPPSVREAIGEVLADMEAVIDGVPVASDLVALQEITDAAIQAATSPPSRTAKRTGYETVASAVGEHSQKITARAALSAPQEVEWEYQCNRGGVYGMNVPVDDPEQHRFVCNEPRLERRRKPGPWEPVGGDDE